MSKEEIRYELETDKNNQEKIFKRDIYDYATPFYFYSDEIKETAKELGFSYFSPWVARCADPQTFYGNVWQP